MTNLLQNLEIDENYFLELLLTGDLYAFEETLYKFVMTQIYDLLAATFIRDVVANRVFEARMRLFAANERMGKLQKRTTTVQLRSGSYLKVETLYARKVPKAMSGSRFLGLRYWGVTAHASPAYYSQVSKLAVLCGSFENVREVLSGLQIKGNLERLRNLAIAVGKKAVSRRVACQLGKDENFRGKRVIISTDGGRIRMREYQAAKNSAGTHHLFETPWREPKLFVLTIIDEEGKIQKRALPIYDAAFGEGELFKLLKEYLKALQIEAAEAVQVIADGALWIWNKAKQMLLELGVREEKIVETLDYYHAVEHLSEMVELLPKREKAEKRGIFQELKEMLWEGKAGEIIEKISSRVGRIGKKMKTEIGYFSKNRERLNYPKYRAEKWLCGSGIIESGVRRMINLRFKSASSFWKQENLDGLIFLRCALLSGRWKNVLETLTSF